MSDELTYGGGVLSGAVSGAVLGSEILPGWGTAIGGVLGAGLGLLGADESVKNAKRQEEAWKESQKDPTTPYKIRLPSGAEIVMYAHGKPKSANPYAGQNNTAAAANEALNTAAYLSQQNKNKKTNAAGSNTNLGEGVNTNVNSVAPVTALKDPGPDKKLGLYPDYSF